MFILDTDIVSLLWRRHERVVDRVRTIGSSVPLAITMVTYIEVLKGRFASVLNAADAAELIRAASRLDDTIEQLNALRLLRFDQNVAEQFDQLRVQKRLKKMGRPDLLIACFALVRKATLVTRNTKDFAGIAGLKLENWAD